MVDRPPRVQRDAKGYFIKRKGKKVRVNAQFEGTKQTYKHIRKAIINNYFGNAQRRRRKSANGVKGKTPVKYERPVFNAYSKAAEAAVKEAQATLFNLQENATTKAIENAKKVSQDLAVLQKVHPSFEDQGSEVSTNDNERTRTFTERQLRDYERYINSKLLQLGKEVKSSKKVAQQKQQELETEKQLLAEAEEKQKQLEEESKQKQKKFEDEQFQTLLERFKPTPTAKALGVHKIGKEASEILGEINRKMGRENFRKYILDPGRKVDDAIKYAELHRQETPGTVEYLEKYGPGKEEEEDVPQMEEEQDGNGELEKDGLNENEIAKLVKLVGGRKLNKAFIGVYSIDELDQVASKVKPNSKAAFILNLDESTKPGSHWVACWIDPTDSKSIEYYDSFGRDPPERFLKDLDLVVNALKCDEYLMLKFNKVVQQSVSSGNCGWFAIKFLIERSKGIGFKECTGWSEVKKGEAEIEAFKKLNRFVLV